MMKTLKLTITLLFITLLIQAQSGEKNFIDQNYLEVTGEAEKEVIPDEIFLGITINESDNATKTSLEDLEHKMFTSLKRIGINLERDLKVEDLSSNFKEHWIKKTQVKTTKDYILKLGNTAQLGKVVLELEKLNISNLKITKVDHSKMSQIKRDLKIEALKEAKIKAVAMAEAIGQSCGRALYILEYQMPRNNYETNRLMRSSGLISKNMADDITPELDFEAIHLEARVMVRFELK